MGQRGLERLVLPGLPGSPHAGLVRGFGCPEGLPPWREPPRGSCSDHLCPQLSQLCGLVEKSQALRFTSKETNYGSPVHTHPPCTHLQGLTGGKEVKTSLSHALLMQFLSEKNK